MREPTAIDVRRTYQRFRGKWDFDKQGPLRLPLIWRTAKEALQTIPDDNAAAQMEIMRIVEVRAEDGHHNGRANRRLVARLNHPAIEVVLDIHPRRL